MWIPTTGGDSGGSGGGFSPNSGIEEDIQRRIDAEIENDRQRIEMERDRIEIERGRAEADAWYQRAQAALAKKRLALEAVQFGAQLGGPSNYSQYADYLSGARQIKGLPNYLGQLQKMLPGSLYNAPGPEGSRPPPQSMATLSEGIKAGAPVGARINAGGERLPHVASTAYPAGTVQASAMPGAQIPLGQPAAAMSWLPSGEISVRSVPAAGGVSAAVMPREYAPRYALNPGGFLPDAGALADASPYNEVNAPDQVVTYPGGSAPAPSPTPTSLPDWFAKNARKMWARPVADDPLKALKQNYRLDQFVTRNPDYAPYRQLAESYRAPATPADTVHAMQGYSGGGSPAPAATMAAQSPGGGQAQQADEPTDYRQLAIQAAVKKYKPSRQTGYSADDANFLRTVSQLAAMPHQLGNQAYESMTATERELFNSALKKQGWDPADVYERYQRSRVGNMGSAIGLA